MRHYNIPIFIPHLGCPFQCVFCDQKRIADREETPEVQAIPGMIEQCLATIPREASEVEIAFFGGSFTAIDQELQAAYLGAVEPYLLNSRVQGLRISTRPDFIDDSILSFLTARGVKTIELGVQSLSDEVLKTSARGYQAADVFKACHLIKKHGCQLGIQLMIGLPGDNYSLDMATTRLAIGLQPDMVRIYPTLVIAGTALEQLYRSGSYHPMMLDEALRTCRDMFIGFEQAGIEVIRMGLQPGEELRRDGTVVAGPFHPSFGELVKQEVCKGEAQALIEDFFTLKGHKPALILWVNPRDLSCMIGQRRANITFLQELYGLDEIKVKTSLELARGQIRVSEQPGGLT